MPKFTFTIRRHDQNPANPVFTAFPCMGHRLPVTCKRTILETYEVDLPDAAINRLRPLTAGYPGWREDNTSAEIVRLLLNRFAEATDPPAFEVVEVREVKSELEFPTWIDDIEPDCRFLGHRDLNR